MCIMSNVTCHLTFENAQCHLPFDIWHVHWAMSNVICYLAHTSRIIPERKAIICNHFQAETLLSIRRQNGEQQIIKHDRDAQEMPGGIPRWLWYLSVNSMLYIVSSLPRDFCFMISNLCANRSRHCDHSGRAYFTRIILHISRSKGK